MPEETVKLRLFLNDSRPGTEKAHAFINPADDSAVWVPKSIVRHISKGAPDKHGIRECQVEVPLWFAEKNGL